MSDDEHDSETAESAPPLEPGTLYVVATPIGNMEDVTLRALHVLSAVDVLACEDTRVTRKILDRHGIERPQRIIAYHEHNEEASAAGIVKLLEEGRTVALCSDGGMPGVSDPGYRVVRAAIEAGLAVDVMPGATAVETALVLSGLPTSSYTFKGFPPRKSGARRNFLQPDAQLPHTLIVFESPFRVAAFLEDALAELGDREAAVCSELTKRFQRVRRGYLSDLVQEFQGKKLKGEFSIVIAGNHPKFVRGTSKCHDK
jgi:16S rRNA (cytidine1402-2'-O)-methyltransferase